MRILIQTTATVLLLLLLTLSATADCDYYYGDDDYDSYSYSNSPGLTPAQAEAYGKTAVAGDYTMRDMGGGMGPEWALHNAMIKLWEDHIVWTRAFIVAVASDSPSVDAVTGRLLQNQVDIGNAIKLYYGEAAGSKLTGLLKEHITIAAEVVKAAKAGDNATMADANRRWFVNADQIAAFLAGANPQAWPEPAGRKMMHDHLNLTTQEAKAELSGDWAGSIAAYDKVHKQILEMANSLAHGIMTQFPAQAGGGGQSGHMGGSGY